jgi:hypothetical protein
MLTPNELSIIKKKMNDKALGDSLTDAIDHYNKAMNNMIDSISYSNIANGVAYKNIDQTHSDTILVIDPSRTNILRQITNRIPPGQLGLLGKDNIDKVEASIKDDSSLLAKFNNQLYIYNIVNSDTIVQQDSNLTKALDENFAAISVGDIRDESASKLESKTTLNVSTIIFWIICVILALLALVKQWSLIPLLGLTTCLYLLTGMTKANWLWFGSWLLIGLVIYFIYGYRKSRLAGKK